MPTAVQPSRLLLVLLMALTALGEVSTQLIIPSLSAIEWVMAAKSGSSLLALSVFVGAFGVGQLALGPLSDRLGRRPILLGGLLIYLLATGWMLCAGSMAEFVSARALQGLGACSALVMARAIVRDVWQANAGPALAITVIGMLCAIAISPALGGLLARLGGWQAPVLTALLLAIMILIAVIGGYRESNPQLDPHAGRLSMLLANYMDLLKEREFCALALTLAFTYGAMFAVIAGSSAVYIGLLHLTPSQFGLTFSAIVTALVVGALFTQRNITRLGPKKLVSMGVSLVALGGLATLAIYHVFGLSLLGLSIPQVLVTLGGGMVLPAAVAGGVIPNAHRAGLAAGFMGFAQMAGATFSGLLLASLQDGSAWPMVFLNGCFAFSAWSAFRLLQRRSPAVGVAMP